MQFGSKVHKIQWVGRYVIGYSENDNEVQIYNSESERVQRYRVEGAAKNGALDPLGQYFAVSATDGQVYIFKVPEDESQQGEMIKKIKVTKLKVEVFGNNPFEIAWTPNGSHIITSGDNALGMITRDNWEINYSKDFAHKKPITCV